MCARQWLLGSTVVIQRDSVYYILHAKRPELRVSNEFARFRKYNNNVHTYRRRVYILPYKFDDRSWTTSRKQLDTYTRVYIVSNELHKLPNAHV